MERPCKSVERPCKSVHHAPHPYTVRANPVRANPVRALNRLRIEKKIE